MSNYPDDINTCTTIPGSPFYEPKYQTWRVMYVEQHQDALGDWIVDETNDSDRIISFFEGAEDNVILTLLRFIPFLQGHSVDITRDDDVIWLDDPDSGENLLQLHLVEG